LLPVNLPGVVLLLAFSFFGHVLMIGNGTFKVNKSNIVNTHDGNKRTR
jgi:hypothetical protein